jgi:hypothetical protein
MSIPVSGPWPYPLPVEGMSRDPEWEVLQEGYGQQGEGRVISWDPVHGWVKMDGPKIQVQRPLRPY